MRGSRLGFLAATLLTRLGATPAWAQDRPYDWQWGMHPMTWMWGAWWIFWMLLMFLFGGLVIAGIVIGIRRFVKTSDDARPDKALDILRQRYARGDINKEEFEAKKRDLGSSV